MAIKLEDGVLEEGEADGCESEEKAVEEAEEQLEVTFVFAQELFSVNQDFEKLCFDWKDVKKIVTTAYRLHSILVSHTKKEKYRDFEKKFKILKNPC